MNQQIERILSQVPAWSGAAAVVTPLVGGITNQNYRVDIGGETFVLRIGGKGTHLLGIDRARERACTAIAAQLGIGAEIVYFLPSQTEEVLITRFIVGEAIAPETAARPEMLRRIVDAIKRYHNGPQFPGAFSPFETVRSYHRLALEYGVSFPDGRPQGSPPYPPPLPPLQRVFALMARIEQAIGPLREPKPCHNDLLASNFIDDGHSIRILDWEYAGMGDLFFDLGNFAVNQSLNEEQCELLLRYYFGEVRNADLAHLHLMRLASDLRESFWGFLQSRAGALPAPRAGTSPWGGQHPAPTVEGRGATGWRDPGARPLELDFDYAAYAHHHLKRFMANVATPQFEQWLRAVRSP